VSSYALDQLRFTSTAILIFRIVAYGSLVTIGVWFLAMPLFRQVSDEQVALYLEEHEPSLHGLVLSAVEFSGDRPQGDSGTVSPALIRRLVERAITSCESIEQGRRIEQPRLKRASGALAGVTLMSAALFLLRPGFVANSAPFLLTPWSAGAGASPYRIDVAPGDTVLPRGADLRVVAELRNFDAETVEISLKRGATGKWTRWPMTVDEETGERVFLAFNVDEDTEYLVEAGGVRSNLFRVEVRDLPYVDRIDLEYRFPAYTGLSPQTEEDGGDIAALVGTRVALTVTPTLPVGGGSLVIDDRDTIPLVPAGGELAGEIVVRQTGAYRVLLSGHGGTSVVASPDYFIDALNDQPPAVSFAKPGRDINVTSIDEVFVEAEAEDDYGIGKLVLVYSVNGGPEDTVGLYQGRGRKRLSAGHTFYLEEIELTPGDFLSYYARAEDRNAVGGRQHRTTDIYFMEIRPFDQRFRQADQQGQPGQQSGGANVGELSSRQRQIVAATFKLVRDTADYADDEMREHLTTLTLAQGRLREEVQTLIDRMASRQVVQLDTAFRAVAEALPLAVQAMDSAEQTLGEWKAQAALTPEQQALQYLQRAEAAFRERQVSQQQGGQGGGQSASAEELADLFDLELDKLRNQYESVDRGERQETSEQVDEVLEKLRELARRQQQENERMRAQAQNQAGSGGGGSQRRLAEEAEEAARQLERLAREQGRTDLEETARRIREAAESMRRAAASQRSDGTARGQSALDRLHEARRLLEQNRSAGVEQDIQDALRRAERLTAEQEDVIRDVERLSEDDPQRSERLQRLMDRKDEMTTEVRDLESQLTEISREARDNQPDAARKLQEAAREMRDTRLADKIAYSRGVIQGRSTEYARNFEEQIGSDLEEVEQRIRDAAGAVGESREQRLGRTLDRARDVASALESLEERIQAAQEGQEAQEGQQGQQEQGGRAAERQRGQPSGAPRGGGAGQISPDDVRQFEGELRQRRGELAELRRELQQEGVDVGELDDVVRGLRALENRGAIGEPRGLAQLGAQIIPGLKEFEYALRRQIISTEDGEQLFLSGSDDVPPEYRDLVEEYYKALSRRWR
jgi:molybdenum-dependent DNA-binding transcriptional regulator ModE